MHPIPTTGRIVHYFHNGQDPLAAANNTDKVPALIIQVFGSKLNLSVFPMNPDARNLLRWSVPHKSELHRNTNTGYWDWPEIAPTLHAVGKSEYIPTRDGESGDLTFKKFNEDNRA